MLEPSELPGRLESFLSTRWANGETVSVSDYSEITGGYSRYMARFTASHGAESEQFVLRADPPPGQSILDTDRTAEWNLVQAVMANGDVTVPDALWFDESGDELGSPGIIFELIDGDTLYTLTQEGEADSHTQHTSPLADLIAGVHAVDTATLPDELVRPTSWSSYIDDNVARWSEVEADHAESDPFMRIVASWLDANRPPEAPLGLVHGDFQAPNILVQEGTSAFHLLDWEMARIGDPREDLGWWALACKSQPPDLIAADSDAFYARYREKSGLSEDVINPATVAYFTVLGALPVFSSVIGQTASMSREETTATSVAYMTNAIPFMHGVFVEAMGVAGGWLQEAK